MEPGLGLGWVRGSGWSEVRARVRGEVRDGVGVRASWCQRTRVSRQWPSYVLGAASLCASYMPGAATLGACARSLRLVVMEADPWPRRGRVLARKYERRRERRSLAVAVAGQARRQPEQPGHRHLPHECLEARLCQLDLVCGAAVDLRVERRRIGGLCGASRPCGSLPLGFTPLMCGASD